MFWKKKNQVVDETTEKEKASLKEIIHHVVRYDKLIEFENQQINPEQIGLKCCCNVM